MTAIDIILGIIVMYGFYLGYSKGIISTVFSVLAFVIGLMAAFKFAPAMTDFLEKAFDSYNPLMFLAGFLLSFVIVMMIIRMVARGLEGALKTANINVLNQLAGGVLLAGVLVFLYSFVLWFGNEAGMIDPKTKRESISYEYLDKFRGQAKGIAIKLQPVFQEFWNETLDMMDKLEQLKPVEEESEPTIYDIPDGAEES